MKPAKSKKPEKSSFVTKKYRATFLFCDEKFPNALGGIEMTKRYEVD